MKQYQINSSGKHPPKITWGVDGYGEKHYLCEGCNFVFGNVDVDSIKHKCKKKRLGL